MPEPAPAMANRRMVKLPGLGRVNQTWVWVGGALVVGIVGYAYLTRRTTPSAEVLTPEEYADAFPQDRTPPPTVVGTIDDTTEPVDAIDTNIEWGTAAVERLSEVGWEPLAASVAVGKFLTRQRLSTAEQDAIRAAMGMLGPPPQDGPWPVTPALPTPAPSTGGQPGRLVGWHSHEMRATTSWRTVARFYANYPTQGNSVEATLIGIRARNVKEFTRDPRNAHKGWVISVPTPSVRAMGASGP